VVEVQPAEAAAVEARPTAPAAEEVERAQPVAAPVDAAAQPEVVAAASCQAPAATEAQVEALVEAAQAPAPAGDLQAEVVEVSDDSPPPGWDQWASFPTRSPEPQEGALVRRHEGHMVAGGRGHGAEASSSRASRPAQVEGAVDDPPAFADARGGAGALGRAPEPQRYARPRAERGAAGPWRPYMARLPGRPWLFVFLLSLVFACCLHVAALMGFDLWVPGARAPCPRQVGCLRPGERRGPPAPGAVQRFRRAC
jgi:hypothetical protein